MKTDVLSRAFSSICPISRFAMSCTSPNWVEPTITSGIHAPLPTAGSYRRSSPPSQFSCAVSLDCFFLPHSALYTLSLYTAAGRDNVFSIRILALVAASILVFYQNQYGGLRRWPTSCYRCNFESNPRRFLSSPLISFCVELLGWEIETWLFSFIPRRKQQPTRQSWRNKRNNNFL